ncbi:MAG: alanine racemase [Ruminiclostridium sp.]|nr:alanine racemase [Ruminiclostridium sp.]
MDLNPNILSCIARHDNFYLYDETVIEDSTARLKAQFPGVKFLYSVKCNPNPHVLDCVFRQGFGADTASPGEVFRARRADLPANKIYYSAPGKSLEDIQRTLGQAVLIADSLGEVQRIQAAAEDADTSVRIGLRINPNFSFLGDSGQPSKFGIDEDQALAFLQAAPCSRVQVTGIHVHLKSQELRADVLSSYYRRMFRLAERIAAVCGPLEYVNMGSGLGIPYGPEDTPLDLVSLGTAFQSALTIFRASYPSTRILIEVGRYAVCQSGIYVTRVVDRKVSHGKTYLILQNTLNGFLRPSLARLVSSYAADVPPAGYEPLFTAEDSFGFHTLKASIPSEIVTLVGNLCTSADVVAEDLHLPHLDPGDPLIITNAGAYAASLSPMQFSSLGRPREFFLTKTGALLTSPEF